MHARIYLFKALAYTNMAMPSLDQISTLFDSFSLIDLIHQLINFFHHVLLPWLGKICQRLVVLV